MDYGRVYDYCCPQPTAEGRIGWIKRHIPVHLIAFIVLAALFAFGPGIHPVPPLFLPALILLLLFTRSSPSLLYSVWVCAIPAVVIGKWFALFSAFTNTIVEDDVQSKNIFSSFQFALIQSILIGLAVSLDRLISKQLRAFRPWIEEFLVFPVVWCAMWTLMARWSPLGDVANYGYALSLLDIEPLTVGISWWFGQLPGGSFAIGLVASCLVYLTRVWVYRKISLGANYESLPTVTEGGQTEIRQQYSPCAITKSHPIAWAFYLLVALFLFGSAYRQFGPYHSFYQRSLTEFAPRYLQVSCLTGASIASTLKHLRHTGRESRLIVWSQGSVSTSNASHLISEALTISQLNHVYIAIVFKDFTGNNESSTTVSKRFHDRLVMIEPPTESQPFASVAFQIDRMKPIKSLDGDSELIAGHEPYELPVVNTPYGRIGALMYV